MPCPHTDVIWHAVPSGKLMGVCLHCHYNVGYKCDCYGCGARPAHVFEVEYRKEVSLCGGCFFKYTVAKAAGREYEFLAGLYRTVQKSEYLPW